ncbi:hypothetical protein D9M71_637950 [compost metagenome]
MPVAGSGCMATIRSRKVLGCAAPNTGVFSIVMCCRRPSPSANSRAMPRGDFAVSGAFGLPPASEKRAITGTGTPENSAERE